jgi:hypothetical protein
MNESCNNPNETQVKPPETPQETELALRAIIHAQAHYIELAIQHMKQGEPHQARKVLEAAKL